MKKGLWLLSASLWLTLAWSQARAAGPAYPSPTGTAPVPGLLLVQMDQPGGTAPATPGSATPSPSTQTAAATPAAADLTTSPTEAGTTPMEMLGDLPPFPVLFRFVPPPIRTLSVSSSNSSSNLPSSSGSSSTAAAIALSTRGFKVADNESPQPLDRIYFSFNDYENLYSKGSQNQPFGISHMAVDRETFGLEKTCLDGNVSIGLRLPLNTFRGDSNVPGLSSNSTDLGDLSIILKGVVCHSEDWSKLVSAGVAVTAPTGPNSFAGTGVGGFHDTTLQPFVGYLLNCEGWYFHGFSEIDVSTDRNDVTLWYNDVGVGYYLYQTCDTERLLTTVAPTLEVHVNTPLNHQGLPSVFNPFGVPDIVDFTAGLNAVFCQKTRLAVGVVVPVTGSKPFDVEALVQLRCAF